ncbi:unnamed protein product [Prorocentrum cordatum]|uniref:BEACH domain-containing protein n=1 Tax=Prorocentrum cordatum TaxID=2364126 RepID=A0ABN9V4M4_9DINO|nr:unnamed protein product [Polarella glacialis]
MREAAGVLQGPNGCGPWRRTSSSSTARTTRRPLMSYIGSCAACPSGCCACTAGTSTPPRGCPRDCVQESWRAVNESTASLMELIPEFFVLPASWLENGLGIATGEGPLADVVLPQWASGITDFVCKMRAALESEWVSQHLPAWIDLIFGCKQAGEEAVKADNLFHPVCYTGSCARAQPPSVSEMPPHVLETQLQEFGRVPRQLFAEAHPPRLRSPRWEPTRLLEEPVQSEAWYAAVRHVAASAAEEATREPALAAAPPSAPGRAPPGAGPSAAGAAPQSAGAPAAGGAGARAAGAAAEPPVAVLRGLRARVAAPVAASGSITGVAACASAYAVGDDGCLRVSPVSCWSSPGDGGASAPGAGRSFRVSPMPLSALAVLERDLLAIGGHDNAVILYSASCGSARARCTAHADTVTCLAASWGRGVLVSGSRDQSVRTWAFTPSGLKNDATFDDVEQPVVCAAAADNLVLAGASDGQVIAWDLRSGRPALERELGGPAAACALHHSERFAVALDAAGELRLWDLRRGCESLRLSVAARAGRGSLASALCFLTDCGDWALVGGAGADGRPAVALWGIPDQRELRSWQLEDGGGCAQGGPEVRFLVPLADGVGGRLPEGGGLDGHFACASASGAVHVFGRGA